MRYIPRSLRWLPLLLCLLVFPTTAHAHSPIKGLGDFYSGLLHPLTTPSHVLIIVAIGLLVGRRRPFHLKTPVTIFSTLSGAALVVATVGGIQSIHPTVMVGIALCAGILLALDRNPSTTPFCALVAVAAVAMGLDSAVESKSAPAVVKTLLGNWISMVVLVCDVAIYVSLGGEAKWLKIALRIAGSWIVAISLLVLAFSIRR